MEEIKLTQNKIALVDDEDFEYLSQYKWCASKSKKKFIVRTWSKGKLISMHRMILGFPDCESIDHINGNPLDNRKSNLRECTNAENNRNKGLMSNNKSGYKGVSKNRSGKKFVCVVSSGDKRKFLGTFDCPIKAAKAYDKHALRLHGEFAYLNFPIEVELDRILGGKL